MQNASGSNNIAIGFNAMNNLTRSGSQAAQYNTAVGYNALFFNNSGSNNIAIGYQAGQALTSNESNDIYIGNGGVAGESNTIRIGINSGAIGQQQLNAYIAGILRTNPTGSGTNEVVIIGSTSQLGSTGFAFAVPTTANYVHAYDTNTQSVITGGSFQAITLSTNGTINGWSHTASSSTFTCNQAGTYLINYAGLCNNSSGTAASTTLSFNVLKNGTEIPGSQTSITFGTLLNQRYIATQEFMVTLAAGDTIVFQFTGTATTDQIITGNGSGTTKPSFSVNIIKIA
jgi:hypothetical protein